MHFFDYVVISICTIGIYFVIKMDLDKKLSYPFKKENDGTIKYIDSFPSTDKDYK